MLDARLWDPRRAGLVDRAWSRPRAPKWPLSKLSRCCGQRTGFFAVPGLMDIVVGVLILHKARLQDKSVGLHQPPLDEDWEEISSQQSI